MCGRMFQKRGILTLIDLTMPRDIVEAVKPLLKKLFEDEANRFDPNFSVCPTDEVFVLASDESGAIEPRIMPWGGKPAWAKSTLFNSRDDKLEGRAWGSSFSKRRCLIFCDGFYEWTGPKGDKQAHAISRSDGNPMAFAGLWRVDDDLPWCSIITTNASPWMEQYHNREPVMIREAQAHDYLASDDPPYDQIRASSDGEMSAFATASPKRDLEPKAIKTSLFD